MNTIGGLALGQWRGLKESKDIQCFMDLQYEFLKMDQNWSGTFTAIKWPRLFNWPMDFGADNARTEHNILL